MDATPPPSGSQLSPTPSQKGGGRKWLFWGCGGCLTLIVLGTLAAVGIVVFVMGVIKDTDVYKEAINSAQQSAEVQAALGSPIEPGWFLQGSVNYNNGAGDATFSVPLSGPKGKATMAVEAKKPAGGSWQYSVLEVRVPAGETIDLRSTR